MGSTHQKVSAAAAPRRKAYTPLAAAIDVEVCHRLLRGRWKLLILFHLFGGQVRRFSDLQRSIAGISQKMLAQQLRQLEEDGLVERTVQAERPPVVDYRLTPWGQQLCPALDGLLQWLEQRGRPAGAAVLSAAAAAPSCSAPA